MKRGWTNKNLMVFGPPRHGKSDLCSVFAPVWWLEDSHDDRVCVASYAAELADHWGRQVRNTVEQSKDQLSIRLARDSSSASRWNIEGQRYGGMFTAGVGGPLSGKGFNLGVIDDPFKNFDEAFSQHMRDKIWDWYRWVFLTRMEPGAKIILTMTRWHEDDLAGRLLAQFPDEWDVLSYPAFAEDNDRLGRKPGEALWPERYNEKALEKKRRESGAQAFEALYQQRPSAEDGLVIKREWWRYYQHLPEGKPSYSIISMDTAFKEGEENDYTACEYWAKYGNDFYLLDLWVQRLEYPKLRGRIQDDMARHSGLPKPEVIIIEDKASGQSLIQDIKRSAPIPVVAIKADSSKLSRVNSIARQVEGGRVFLPATHPLTEGFVNEFCAFPLGAHDDQVDAGTQAIKYLKGAEVWVV
jgi:predicted phage terminase large subunit-like protein